MTPYLRGDTFSKGPSFWVSILQISGVHLKITETQKYFPNKPNVFAQKNPSQ